jgi:hypothetical protein
MEHKDCNRTDSERCKCHLCSKHFCSSSKDGIREVEGHYVFFKKSFCSKCWESQGEKIRRGNLF